MADKTIPNKLASAAIKDQVNLNRYSINLSKKVVELLDTAQSEIVAAIAKNDPTAPTMTKWKAARLEKLNEDISAILDSSFKDIKKTSLGELLQVGHTQASNVVSATNKAIGVDLFQVTLTPENVTAIVQNTMIDGNIIGAWWDKQKDTAKSKLVAQMAAGTQALQIGMVQGESVGQLISRVRGTKLTPGVMSVTKREAAALTRTSVMQVAGAVRHETLKANSDVLNGYEIVATLDDRTTLLCSALDGKRYDLDFQPIGHKIPYPIQGGPPFHWGCRSCLVGITKSYAELVGAKSPLPQKVIKELDANIPIGERASMNGPVSGLQTYDDWIKFEPEDVQKEILGQGKWKLWKENKLDMADLINNAGRELTIKELQASMGDILAEKAVVLENKVKQYALEARSADQFFNNVSLSPLPFKSVSALVKEKGGWEQYWAEMQRTVEAQKIARAEAKLIKNIADPEEIVTFKAGQKIPAGIYTPVEGAETHLAEDVPAKYGKLKMDVNTDLAMPFQSLQGYKQSAGMIVIDEETGKVWLCSPKNQFGGYKNTFPKGTMPTGISSFQKQAIKEVFEETGLQAEPLALLGDYKKTTSVTRYYIGVKTGGTPTMMGWESEAVQLVPINQLKDVLNVAIDKKIAEDFIVKYQKAMELGKGDIKEGLKLLTKDAMAEESLNELAMKYPSLYESAFADLKKMDNWESLSSAQKQAFIETNAKYKAQTAIDNWAKAEPSTVAGSVYKNKVLTKNVLSDYAEIKQSIAIAENSWKQSLEELIAKNPNAKLASENLKKSGAISESMDVGKKMEAIIKEANEYNTKLDVYLNSIEKESIQGEALVKIKKDYPKFDKLDSLKKIEQIEKTAEVLKKDYYSQIAKIDISKEGQEALVWGKTNGIDWKDLYENKPKQWLETMNEIISSGKYKKVVVEHGELNGKLLTDLSKSEFNSFSMGSGMMEAKYSWANIDSNFKDEFISIWKSLDSSVKREYMVSWKNKGIEIPSELLGTTEKKLMEQSIGLQSISPERILLKELNDLGYKSFKDVQGKYTAVYDKLSPTAKEMFPALGDTIQNAFENLFATAKKEGATVKSQYRITTLKDLADKVPIDSINNMEDFYALKIDPKVISENPYEIGHKLTNSFHEYLDGIKGSKSWATIYNDVFTKLEDKVGNEIIANKIKLGKTTYDLSIPEQKAKFEASKKFYVNEYANKIAYGKKVAPAEQAAYDLLNEAEKAKLQQSIGKKQAKKGIVSPVSSTKKASGIDFNSMVQYGEQGGSNEGGFYHSIDNPAERYYIKIPNNTEVARNEVLAGKLYQAAGVEVPDLQLIDVNGRTGVASTVMDGVDRGATVLKNGTFRAGIQDNFVVDAWLGDWDVVGQNFDNLLIKDGSRGVRIDVGGSLRFRAQGLPKGLDFGNEVTELNSMRSMSQNSRAAAVFKNITQVELDAGARKVLSITDDQIRNLVNEYGPTSPMDRKELADTLIARKQYIQQQFPHIKVGQSAPAQEEGKAITQAEMKAIQHSRINGYTIKGDVEDIEDHQIQIWIEKNKAGKDVAGISFKIRGEAESKIKTILGGASSKGEYEIAKIHDPILEALRGIAMQSRNGAALRGDKDIVRANNALSAYRKELASIKKSGRYSVTDIVAFENHYKPWINILNDAVELGEGKILKIAHDTDIHDAFQRFSLMEKKTEETKKASLKLVKKEGGNLYAKEIGKGFAKETEKTLDRAQGVDKIRNFYEGEYNGVKIRYWSNNSSWAMNGRVQIIADGSSPEDIEKALKLFSDNTGINMAKTTPIQQELMYLKQVAYARNDSFGHDILSQANAITGESEAVRFLQNKLSDKVGFDITKSPYYNPDGVASTFQSGRLNYYRPDIDINGKEWQDFEKEYRIVKSIEKGPAETLEDVLNNGGEMISNTERLRKGMDIGGWSPETDLDSGGADYFFTRIKPIYQVEKGDWSMAWKPEALLRTDALSFAGDPYGRTTGTSVLNRKSTIADWVRISDNANETNFKQAISIFDPSFDKWVVSSKQIQDQMIQIMKNHKYNTWPDGRKLEDVIVVR